MLNWCPSPNCDLIVQANMMPIYDLTCVCQCECQFCFKCSELPHEPIPCAMIRVWNQNDNDATFEYLSKFAKECPQCHSLIEKNGGCNHMVMDCPLFHSKLYWITNYSIFFFIRHVKNVAMNFAGFVTKNIPFNMAVMFLNQTYQTYLGMKKSKC